MRFLIVFRGIHNHLRVPELRSVLCLLRGCQDRDLTDLNLVSAYDILTGATPPVDDPLHVRGPARGAAGVVLYGEVYAYITLRSEAEAAALCARCMLMRAILRPLGHGLSRAACIANVSEASVMSACAPLFESPAPSYRVVVEAFGRSLGPAAQLERVHAFSFVHARFPGHVRLRSADHELWVIEDAFPPAGHGYRTPHPAPRQVLLGRLVSRGAAGLGAAFSLKRRVYIGPTSMDAELAFVMANFARIAPGAIAVDPFAGTGGVLVPCAKLGAYTVAADINIIALRGKAGRGIGANFAQYKLQAPLGVLRCDMFHSAFRRREGGWFDAVVTDPPYGIKEGAKAFREESVDSRIKDMHYQGTERVRFHDLLNVLLEFAAAMLVSGGRLVYWLPTTPEYCDSDVPTHPMLKLVHNCEQPLTSRMSRRLIVMVRKDGVSASGKVRNQIVQREVERRPAHFDLAARLLHQPEREESRLRVRNYTNK